MDEKTSASSTPLQEVLAGDLGLTWWQPQLDHTRINTLCETLRRPENQHLWAATPWGRTLPRSCVGTNADRYLGDLKQLPQELINNLHQAFFVPVAALFGKYFATRVRPLHTHLGQAVPAWALREMASGEGIPPHCEQDWNDLNLIETGALLKPDFEPRFQMSFLYGVQSATEGGELALTESGERHHLCPGHLLLFNAGSHRHQVLPTHGRQLRVVLGGFLRLNRSHTSLHCYV